MILYKDLQEQGFSSPDCVYILGLIHKEKNEVYKRFNDIFSDRNLTNDQVIEKIAELLDNEGRI